jgi:sugar phosphate permease
MVSAICLALGSWFLMLAPLSFDAVFAGFFLVGISSAFSLNSIIRFIFAWFSPKRRPLFYSILGLATLVGTGLGPLIPFIFIRDCQDHLGGIFYLFILFSNFFNFR